MIDQDYVGWPGHMKCSLAFPIVSGVGKTRRVPLRLARRQSGIRIAFTLGDVTHHFGVLWL